MKKTPDHIEQEVVKLKEEGVSYRNIAKDIKERLNYHLGHGTIVAILQRAKNDVSARQVAFSELEKDLKDESHEYDDLNLYVYTSKIDKNGDKIKVRHEVPFDVLNPMVYDYVRKGRNMTQQEVMDKYMIKDKVWNALKKALNLTKHSGVTNEIYLKILEEKYGTEKMEEYVEETAFKAMDRYREIELRKMDKAEQREVERVMRIIKSREHRLDNLQRYLTTYEPIKVDFKREIIKNNDVYDVGMSDFHFGYNSEKVAIRMHRATNYLLNRPEKHINIMCLGDLVENIVGSGEMHPGQQRHQDMYGFDLTMFAVAQIENMLIQLYRAGKEVKFVGIGGNHDRLAKDHNEDMQREGALVMYELIKRGLKDMDIDIRYLCEKTNVFDTSKIRYIIHHGDDGFSNRAQKNPDKILWDHGDTTKNNVIMYGDKHNVKVQETNNATIVGLPALADRGEYTKRLDLYSEPGIVGIEHNQYGGVDIHIKRL